jgi:hypothetical protein
MVYRQAWVEHLQRSETVTIVTVPDDSPVEGDTHHSVRCYRVVRGSNGFGMSLKSDVVTRGVRVNDMIVDGPAETAGILVGDVITHINGESMLDKSHDEVVAALAASDEVAEIEVQHRTGIDGGERIVALECKNGAGIKYGVRANGEYPQVRAFACARSRACVCALARTRRCADERAMRTLAHTHIVVSVVQALKIEPSTLHSLGARTHTHTHTHTPP